MTKTTVFFDDLPQREQLAFHALPRVHVERAERLVHQHDPAIDDPVLRHRGALAHAAAQLRGIVLGEGGQAHARQPAVSARERLGPCDAGEQESERHVVAHGFPRQQRVLLKHVGGRAVETLEVAIADADAARGLRRRVRPRC